MPTEELVTRSEAWLRSRWQPIAPLVQERARTLADVFALTDFLYLPKVVIDPDEWDKVVRKTPAFGEILAAAVRTYAALEEWTAEAIEEATVAAGEAAGVTQLGKAQAPIRLAVTGRSVGVPLWQSLPLLGQDRTLARLAAAQRRLE
jgi:glutamyl-tRNA synthetase